MCCWLPCWKWACRVACGTSCWPCRRRCGSRSGHCWGWCWRWRRSWFLTRWLYWHYLQIVLRYITHADPLEEGRHSVNDPLRVGSDWHWRDHQLVWVYGTHKHLKRGRERGLALKL
jgi:hypothetical protein